MKTRLMQLLLAATLLHVAGVANAVQCSNPPAVSSSGFTIGSYDPATVGTTSTSTTVSGSCTRVGGPGGMSYTVAAGTGLNPSGGSNRARFGTNYINYAVTTDAGCSTTWNGANLFTFVFSGNPAAPSPQSRTYYGCVSAGQYVAALTYSDTVIMTTTNPIGGAASTNTFPVSITVASRCTMINAPGAIAFTYTAFGAAQTANTTYRIVCNSLLPYSADIGGGASGSGVVSGLNYSLGIDTSGSGGSNPLASTGTGTTQTFYINGSMAAGQAGTCASGTCAGTVPRTLTVTY